MNATAIKTSRVRIKREWCETDEEHQDVYTVLQVLDRTDLGLGVKYDITPEEWDYAIRPIECVDAEMVEPVL